MQKELAIVKLYRPTFNSYLSDLCDRNIGDERASGTQFKSTGPAAFARYESKFLFCWKLAGVS